jgi:hypothetical protein
MVGAISLLRTIGFFLCQAFYSQNTSSLQSNRVTTKLCYEWLA